MTTRRALRSRNVSLSATFSGLVVTVGALTGCNVDNDVHGDDEQTVQAYCADTTGSVIDATRCEDTSTDTGPSFIYLGHYGSRYDTGEKLPRNRTTGVASAGDRGQRTSLGIPATGGFGGNGATVAATAGG